MSEEIKIALISGIVSFVISAIGFISSWLTWRTQRHTLERTLQNQFTDKLYILRLEHYPEAFSITERIQRRPEPNRIVDQEELLNIKRDLSKWRVGVVSLIISANSLEAYNTLRNALSMGHGDAQRYTKSQADKIIAARDTLRSSLRHDLGFLYEEDRMD